MYLRAFHGQLRVHHVGGALIPPFRAPLVTKLYKFIRLSIENLLIFIRIQLDKHARNYVAISSNVTMALISISCVFACHYKTDHNFRMLVHTNLI